MSDAVSPDPRKQDCNVKICSPALLPLGGMRPLGLQEMARRYKAMNCIREKTKHQCQGQVYINLFFDGTENNQNWRPEELGGRTQKDCGKHSNIARLYNASIDEPDNGFFSYYIPGLGTPFSEIGDNGGALGSGFGYMGADRINWGVTRVFNAVHFYVTRTNLLADGEAGAFANEVSRAFSFPGRKARERKDAFQELKARLLERLKGRTPVVTSINLAVFGFSRGAATARAFANWLFELMEKDRDGTYLFAGIPLRIGFMGLFDTVASVGMPDSVTGADGHMNWADNNMHISPTVEQCVHLFSLHEQRASFPLEMGSHIKQVAYPGMHADVGGGYLPNEQGKTLQLSQIPLLEMYRAAIVGGVALKSMEEIQRDRFLKADFECPDKLIKAFNEYQKTCGINSNAAGVDGVKSMVHAHTRQYLQWRKTLDVERLEGLPFYQRATSKKERKQLLDGVVDFQSQLKTHRLNRVRRADYQQKRTWVEPGTHFSTEMDPDLSEILHDLDVSVAVPEGVRTLMEDYVHDSRAGFRPIGNFMELGEGYFRYRNVYQNGWYKQEVSVPAKTVAKPMRAIGSYKAAG